LCVELLPHIVGLKNPPLIPVCQRGRTLPAPRVVFYFVIAVITLFEKEL
jgi:hypothetical protein